MKKELKQNVSLNPAIIEELANDEMLLVKGGKPSLWDRICDAINFSKCNSNCNGCSC